MSLIKQLDEKISFFKADGVCTYNAVDNFWQLPTTVNGSISGLQVLYSIQGAPLTSNQVYFYRLGTIIYKPKTGYPVELQRLQRNDFYNIDQSPLTRPTEDFPCYLYEEIEASILRKPKDVVWAFTTGGSNQYLWDFTNSTNFELEQSEQVNVILRILQYSGIVIRDPQIIQAASAEIAQSEANKKS
jgi:hypothetical protein